MGKLLIKPGIRLDPQPHGARNFVPEFNATNSVVI